MNRALARHSLLPTAWAACLATLSACGFAHVEIAEPMQDSARYRAVLIDKISVESYEKNPNALALNERFTSLVERLLREEVSKRFTIADPSASTQPGTLVVSVHIYIQYGNRGLRYIGFGGAGAVDSTLTAIEGATGEVRLQVSSLSDLVVGLFGGDMKSTVEGNIRALVAKSGLGG
jgi:hypothetical protein